MTSGHPTAIQSMTGFAAGEGSLAGRRYVFEIRSLNHRHLESKWRLPKELSFLESHLRDLAQKKFHRGMIEGRVEWVREAQGEDGPQINVPQAAQYFEALQSLQRILGLKDKIETHHLLSLPEVITKGAPKSTPEALESAESWAALRPDFEKSAEQLHRMRQHEGEAIRKSLTALLKKLHQQVLEIHSRRKTQVPEVQTQIRARVSEILGGSVHEERMHQEALLWIERTDIAEELSRLENHVAYFETTLSAGGPMGRKLEFITQEMNREVNTLSSKAQDFAISQQAVELKIALEQMREQVLNVE